MRYVGIDIGSEKHFFAVVNAEGEVARKATSFFEDDVGYAKLLAELGEPVDALVAMPAKVALVAAMRKLLHAIYSVAKNRRAFVPHLSPTEAPA